MAYRVRVCGMCWSQILRGYVRLSRGVSIRRLESLRGKGCQTNSLPIGLNRISWKLFHYRMMEIRKENPTDWVKSD